MSRANSDGVRKSKVSYYWCVYIEYPFDDKKWLVMSPRHKSYIVAKTSTAVPLVKLVRSLDRTPGWTEGDFSIDVYVDCENDGDRALILSCLEKLERRYSQALREERRNLRRIYRIYDC